MNKKEDKKIDWQESKMLPPVTSSAWGPTPMFFLFFFFSYLISKHWCSFLEHPWESLTGLTKTQV